MRNMKARCPCGSPLIASSAEFERQLERRTSYFGNIVYKVDAYCHSGCTLKIESPNNPALYDDAIQSFIDPEREAKLKAAKELRLTSEKLLAQARELEK